MIDFKAQLYSYLSTFAPVTSLVGTRIYPVIAAPGAPLPYIVYERINRFDAAPWQAGRSDLLRATYQFSCWDRTSVGLETLTRALWENLDGYTGPMGAAWVQSWRYTDALDGIVSPSEGGIEGTYRTILTADIWHTLA